MIRLHIKLRATIVAFFAVCITLLFFVKYNTCRSYIETWAGMLPVEVNYTCLILLFRCQRCLPSPGSQLQRRSNPFIRISSVLVNIAAASILTYLHKHNGIEL